MIRILIFLLITGVCTAQNTPKYHLYKQETESSRNKKINENFRDLWLNKLDWGIYIYDYSGVVASTHLADGYQNGYDGLATSSQTIGGIWGNLTGTTFDPLTLGVFEVFNPTCTLNQYASWFGTNGTGRLIYRGEPTKLFLVTCHITYFTTDPWEMRLYLNGSWVDNTRDRSDQVADQIGKLYLSQVVELSTDDYLEIYVTHFAGGGEANLQSYSITAIASQ